jgi:hypothetical protein
VSTPALIAHEPAFAPPSVQVNPVGRVSLRVTFSAVTGPLFVTVIENTAF